MNFMQRKSLPKSPVGFENPAWERGNSHSNETFQQPARSNTTSFGWVRAEEFCPAIDVVVVPSIWREPFGRVSIEGACYGAPAIVTRVGGLPENVQHGRDGFAFEPRHGQGLAELLERLVDDAELYNRISGGARERAELIALDRIGQDGRLGDVESWAGDHTRVTLPVLAAALRATARCGKE